MCHLDRNSAGGLHINRHPVGRAISRYRAAHGADLYQLLRRRREHGDEVCHPAPGRGRQRRPGHDLHDLEGLLDRRCGDLRVLQAGRGSRHGGRERPEPRERSSGAAARRRDEGRREGGEAPEQHPADLRRAQCRRQARRGLRVELRRHQHQTEADAHHRRGQRAELRQHLRPAHLAQARRDGAVRPHSQRHLRRHRRTELRVGRGFAGRAVGELLPVLHAVQGHAEDRGGVQRHRGAHQRRRPSAAPERRGGGEDRRHELQLHVEHHGQPGCHVPGLRRPGRQRHGGECQHQQDI